PFGPGPAMVDVLADAARSAHQYDARRHIPWGQAHFPIAIVAAAGRPGQVQGRRAHAPDPAGGAHRLAQRGHVLMLEREVPEREAGGQDGLVEFAGARAMNASTV